MALLMGSLLFQSTRRLSVPAWRFALSRVPEIAVPVQVYPRGRFAQPEGGHKQHQDHLTSSHNVSASELLELQSITSRDTMIYDTSPLGHALYVQLVVTSATLVVTSALLVVTKKLLELKYKLIVRHLLLLAWHLFL